MSDYLDGKIILASGSARRKEIFESHGYDPVIMPMDVDETLPDDISPQDAVMYLALKKGLAAEQSISKEEHALIVSADTIVYAKDVTTGIWTIMGKPKDDEDAWRMLKSIVGTDHKVMTGVALLYTGHDLPALKRAFYDSTNVYVNPMTNDEIKAYIDSGEPFGKAGGYAIQMEFGKYIDHIEGDYENVVGFPYQHMLNELAIL